MLGCFVIKLHSGELSCNVIWMLKSYSKHQQRYFVIAGLTDGMAAELEMTSIFYS